MIRLHRSLRDQLHFVFAAYGCFRYWWQYRRLKIVAVTGTDGKSSTVVLAARLLKAARVQTAYYSSVSINDGRTEVVNGNKMTTPGKAALHHFLAKSARNGSAIAVVEITSEGIKQWRHFGIQFAGIIFTTLTPEHIERHGSFSNYKATKLSLVSTIRKNGFVVWNANDDELATVSELSASLKSVPVKPEASETDIDPFSYTNYALAQAAVQALGYRAVLGPEYRSVPGRFEYFPGHPAVLVDYAHTPHALGLCLNAARHLTSGRLIHVFGAAGGGRDTWKRPLLAQISERHADIHILTEENSFDEPVVGILTAIASGFSSAAVVYKEPKREAAIKLAFSMAAPGDLIVCTAKGSEVVIAGPQQSKRPYNEREFIQACQSGNLN